MIVTSTGLLVAFLLILFGLCVSVTAAALLPDLPPPASGRSPSLLCDSQLGRASNPSRLSENALTARAM
jgi:hypothetical protein